MKQLQKIALFHCQKMVELFFVKEQADQGYSHAEKLHVFIDEVIKECQVDIKEINAVAVSKGPGSYTGLRIGVSERQVCYALN